MSASRKRGADKSVELDGEPDAQRPRKWQDSRFEQMVERELKVMGERIRQILENGPRRIVRLVCMGELIPGGKAVIALYHKCDITPDRPIKTIGVRSLDLGIGKLTFDLSRWNKVDAFIDGVVDVLTKLDEDPMRGDYEKIFEFINGLVTELANENQKLFDLTNVSLDPEPTEKEQAMYDELAAVMEKHRKAGVTNAVIDIGDASKASHPMTETEIRDSRCWVCHGMIPYSPFDEAWNGTMPKGYVPTSPSYSPTYDD